MVLEEQEQNKKKTRRRHHTTPQKIATGVTPLQRGPTCQSKRGGPKEDALVDKDEDPHVNQHAKDRTKRLTGGAGRHLGSATPGSDPVQVHFGEE